MNNPGALPDFVIIGTQKGGTIALWENLSLHPQIYLPFDSKAETPREKHFFDWYWNLGVDWYKSHFNRPWLLQGEKTPFYMTESLYHRRMAAIIPRAKLICLLRNPVDRAYSAWNMKRSFPKSSKWHLSVGFEEAIDHLPSLFNHGKYIDQLESLLNYFPRDQIFIGISERFRMKPDINMSALLEFLEVKPINAMWQEHHVRKYQEKMSENVREKLNTLYMTYNERLFELLGERIEEWD